MNDWTTRRLRKARLLLQPVLAEMKQTGGTWADLGCGDGVFTRLLCQWLEPGSTIYAVDRDPGALRRLEQALGDRDRGVTIHPLRADFTASLSLPPLDGMLLANSLHFVRNKTPVLRQLAALVKPGGCVIIIEYNANRGNWAVPHPIDADACLALIRTVGLCDAQIATTAPSSFLGEMYAAVARKSAPAQIPGVLSR